MPAGKRPLRTEIPTPTATPAYAELQFVILIRQHIINRQLHCLVYKQRSKRMGLDDSFASRTRN